MLGMYEPFAGNNNSVKSGTIFKDLKVPYLKLRDRPLALVALKPATDLERIDGTKLQVANEYFTHSLS